MQKKREKKENFFLKALGIQSTVSHLRALTGVEIRVFLNATLLQEHSAWVRQAGISVYHTPTAQQGPSPTPQTHAAVYAAGLISGGPLRCRFPGAPHCPWGASFPHIECFHATSSHGTHGSCVSSATTQGKLQPQSQTLRFKPLLHLFFFWSVVPCFPFLQ